MPDWVIDQASLERASGQLAGIIREEIESLGGNYDRDSLSLVFGFCTSHFSVDPAPAFAARALASDLCKKVLVDGESVTSIAWELEVWADRPNEPARRAVYRKGTENIDRLWPLTAQAGSKGGHDTEKAIVGIAAQVKDPTSSIVILSANSAGTVVPAGYRALGSNAPEYLNTLSRWKRLPASTKSGASTVVPYLATDKTGRRQSRSFDLVILVPRAWAAASLSGGLRSEQLRRPIRKTTTGETNPTPLLIVAGILILVVILLAIPAIRDLVWSLAHQLSGKGQFFVKVGDRTENLGQIPDGGLVFRIVGPGAPDKTPKDVIHQDGPPLTIGEVYRRDRRTVEIEPKGLALVRVGSEIVNIMDTRYGFRTLGETEVLFSGTLDLVVGAAPKQYDVELRVNLTKERGV